MPLPTHAAGGFSVYIDIVPYHGKIKKVQHVGQTWTLVIELPGQPDYAAVFDNAMFAVFYRRITGGGDLVHDLLIHGEWAIPHVLLRQRIFTPSRLAKAGDSSVQ
jgi:hypothetical protein